MADMIASLAAKLRKLDSSCDESEECCTCTAEAPVTDAKRSIKEKSITHPIPENTVKYRKIFERYKRIAEALAPIYHET